MKKILITGGNGFVGIYFAKKLFNNNVKLDIVDITEQRHIYCSEYFKKDCRD
jgi:nucleoside-diphosphate-sugar epimerase